MSDFNNNDIQELKDIVRIGITSSVNIMNLTARVKIQDHGTVTGDLKIVQNTPGTETNPWIPEVGQWVLCIFKPDGEGDGFILGGI